MIIESGSQFPIFKKNNLILKSNIRMGYKNRKTKIIVNTPVYVDNNCILEIGEIEEGVMIEQNCVLRHISKIGAFSTIKQGVKVIDQFVPSDTGCEIINLNSIFDGKFSYTSKYCNKNIIISEQVWIGSYAKLTRGITIGKGAVISSGSVVVTDVEPYTIVSGVPAEKIGMVAEERKNSDKPRFEGTKKRFVFYAENGEVEMDAETVLKLPIS